MKIFSKRNRKIFFFKSVINSSESTAWTILIREAKVKITPSRCPKGLEKNNNSILEKNAGFTACGFMLENKGVQLRLSTVRM